MMRDQIFIPALVLIVLLGTPPLALAATYHGKVVDAETGEPLKGAVIAVIWYKKPFLSMDGPVYFHNAKEALTDAGGKFSLDASPGIDWNPLTFVREPEIIIFQPGYGPLSSHFPRDFRDIYGIKDALEKGALIKLPKLKTKKELRAFGNLGSLGFIHNVPDEKIPNLIRLTNLQRKIAGFQSLYKEPAEKGKLP